MKTKMTLIVVVSMFFMCSSVSTLEEDPLTISLFYESYCPDCQDYVQNQLLGAWTKFKDHIVLDLIPYGKAKQSFVDGHWEFDCQHGPEECLANKLHACAIYQACGGKQTVSCEVSSVTKVVTFISCLEAYTDQLAATSQCAKKAKLEPNSIISCMKSNIGDTLLSSYGNRTAEFTPTLRQVPTVAVNGEHDEAAEEDLIKEICRLRPDLCDHLDPQVIQV